MPMIMQGKLDEEGAKRIKYIAVEVKKEQNFKR
jgi:hypothetical protein